MLVDSERGESSSTVAKKNPVTDLSQILSGWPQLHGLTLTHHYKASYYASQIQKMWSSLFKLILGTGTHSTVWHEE